MKYKILMAIAIFGLLLLSQTALKADGDTLWCHYTYPTSIYAVKFTPDGQYLATGGSDGVVTIWNALTGDSIKKYSNNGYIYSLDISPDGKFIAMANNTDSIPVSVYNFQNDSLLAKFRGTAVKFSNDGNYLITNMISIIDTHTWQIVKSINVKSPDNPHCIDISPDNLYIATGSYWAPYSDTTGFANLYSFSNGYITTLEKEKGKNYPSVCFSPDSKYVAVASSDGTAKVFTTVNQKLYKTFNHYSEVDAIAFSPDGKYLVEGGGYFNHYRTNIWEISSDAIKYTYTNNYLFSQSDGTHAINVNKDGTLISFGGGGGIYILNAKWNPVSVSDDIITITNNTIYPNPTSSVANIEFTLTKQVQANISIYDNNSNLITTIYNGLLESGIQSFQWNTSGIVSGIYFCNININNTISTIKIIVNK